MRLGRLILQLCALFIAGALIVGGYVFLRNREVASFQLEPGRSSSLSAILAHWSEAPAMVCEIRASNFDAAEAKKIWTADGRTRIDARSLAGGVTSHVVADADSAYVWDDSSDEIVHINTDIAVSLDESLFVPSLFSQATCYVWWFADMNVFRIPANLPLIEYEG